jgi:hypothetical protein
MLMQDLNDSIVSEQYTCFPEEINMLENWMQPEIPQPETPQPETSQQAGLSQTQINTWLEEARREMMLHQQQPTQGCAPQ